MINFHRFISTYSVKRYYIQDYSENFRGNTETSLRFHLAVNEEQSNQEREKYAYLTCGEGRDISQNLPK